MNGIVNKALADAVITRYGSDVWNAVTEKVQLTQTTFVALDYYPDELTYQLVGAAVEITGTPAPEFLESFGRHFLHFVRSKESYGGILDSCGSSFEEILSQLDNLHMRVSMVMPKLRPPRFNLVRKGEGHYWLEYISSRPGLSPLLGGLIHGLAERFGQTAEITPLPGLGENTGSSWFNVQVH